MKLEGTQNIEHSLEKRRIKSKDLIWINVGPWTREPLYLRLPLPHNKRNLFPITWQHLRVPHLCFFQESPITEFSYCHRFSASGDGRGDSDGAPEWQCHYCLQSPGSPPPGHHNYGYHLVLEESDVCNRSYTVSVFWSPPKDSTTWSLRASIEAGKGGCLAAAPRGPAVGSRRVPMRGGDHPSQSSGKSPAGGYGWVPGGRALWLLWCWGLRWSYGPTRAETWSMGCWVRQTWVWVLGFHGQLDNFGQVLNHIDPPSEQM